MDVTQALRQRRSVRAFLPDAPPAALVQTLLQEAAQAASGGNLQPWRVVALTGEPLRQVLAAVATAPAEDAPTNQSYPPSLWVAYRTGRFGDTIKREIEAQDKLSSTAKKQPVLPSGEKPQNPR